MSLHTPQHKLPATPPVRLVACPQRCQDGYVTTGGVTQRCAVCFGRGRITTEGAP
jgi:hypothetical protein